MVYWGWRHFNISRRFLQLGWVLVIVKGIVYNFHSVYDYHSEHCGGGWGWSRPGRDHSHIKTFHCRLKRIRQNNYVLIHSNGDKKLMTPTKHVYKRSVIFNVVYTQLWSIKHIVCHTPSLNLSKHFFPCVCKSHDCTLKHKHSTSL